MEFQVTDPEQRQGSALERRAEELIEELSAESERIEYTPVPAGAYFSNSGEPTEPEPQGPTQESDRFWRAAKVIEQLLSENRQVRLQAPEGWHHDQSCIEVKAAALSR